VALLAPQRLQLRLPRQLRRVRAPIEYNYRGKAELEAAGVPVGEWVQPFDLHAISVFLRDGDRAFHTYSTYARGTDNLGFISSFLEADPARPAGTVGGAEGTCHRVPDRARDTLRYHDEYDD
jgi:predicted dithiol-disulfide oxidoreductase (DUF899 family)